MNRWIIGARPRTLPAAVVPVAIGTALCASEEGALFWRSGLALAVSVALQVGVNYANDYSDGIRGTDDGRVGPVRLVAGQMASAQAVRRAAVTSFLVAAAAGAILALVTTPWLLLIGAAAIAAGWFYTGGPSPYGYAGFGELFVFVFFGLVATVGSVYVVIERIPGWAWVLGAGVGCWACALLVVNNLRDIPTDRQHGKRTLAVRLGDRHTRTLYIALVVSGICLGLAPVVYEPWCWVVAVSIFWIVTPIRTVTSGAVGRDLVPVLERTGRAQLVFGALVCIALIVGR